MGLLLAWLVETGLITWRDLTGKAKNHTVAGLPIPADYIATFVIFGALGFVPKDNVGASRTAALVGWAYVVATYLNVAPALINPTGKTASTSAASTQTTPTTASTSTTISQ
jgi:hypothetical protein